MHIKKIILTPFLFTMVATFAVFVTWGCSSKKSTTETDGSVSDRDAEPDAESDGGIPDGSVLEDSSIPADGGNETTSAWRLQEGYYVPRKMDMQIIAPRPMAEMGSLNAYRHSHPAIPYVRPIGVQGGAWPFRYELVEGPPGASIGEILTHDPETLALTVPDDYGVVQCPPLAEGTYTFKVRVYDQDYGRADNPSQPVEVEWQVVSSAANWFVVSPSANGGTGTYEDPYSWSGFLNADSGNRLALLRGGDFGVQDVSIDLATSTRTRSLIGHPGETPLFRNVRFDWNTNPDRYCSGITIDDGISTASTKWMNWVNAGDRTVFFDNHYKNLGPGSNPEGFDNPSAIFVPRVNNDDPSQDRKHFAIIRCTADGFGPLNPNTANGPSLAILYHIQESLYELNTVTNCTGYGPFFPKARCWNFTLRGNRAAINNTTGGRGWVTGGAAATALPPDHLWNFDISWNVIRGGWGFPISSSVDPAVDNIWIYRNSIFDVSPWHGPSARMNHHIHWEKNVHNSSESDVKQADPTIWTHTDEAYSLEDDTAFDDEGNLQGSAKTTHFGLRGGEPGGPLLED